MNNTKEKRASVQVTVSALVLTVVLIAEIYLMVNYVGAFLIPIIILGVVALVAVFLLVNAMLTISAEREAHRQAQLENLYKSEKASYIMVKKRFQEIESKLAVIQETSKIPSEEIINAQKGIAKVIINRSKENADAIINSNDQVLERLDEIDETQNNKFTGISKDQRLKLTEMSNQTELRLQDMVVQLKDMELRLNQAIMQGTSGRPVAEDVAYVDEFGIDAEQEFEEEGLFVEEAGFEEEPIVVEDEPVFEEETIAVEDEPVFEEELVAVEDEPVFEEEPIVVEEEPVIEETPVASVEPAGDPNKAMSADDIAALFASMASTESEETEIVEPEVEDLPPMPDLSDPNRALTPDEIAALIANL